MNRTEENKLSMFRTLNSVLEDHKSDIAEIAALEKSATRFKQMLSDILDDDTEFKSVSAGATSAKNVAAENLISQLMAASGALFVMGKTIGNEQIKAECKLTKSKLRRGRKTRLIEKGIRILEMVKANASTLGEYGITEQKIINLALALKVFNGMLEVKENKGAKSKALRVELSDVFDLADDILKNELDPLMEMVRVSNVEFYNQYHAARVIKDLGLHTSRKKEIKPESDAQK